MPRKPANLDGKRFGSLTVEHITDQRNSYGRLLYICRCDCGNTRLATAANLKRGEDELREFWDDLLSDSEASGEFRLNVIYTETNKCRFYGGF